MCWALCCEPYTQVETILSHFTCQGPKTSFKGMSNFPLLVHVVWKAWTFQSYVSDWQLGPQLGPADNSDGPLGYHDSSMIHVQ